MNKTISWKIRNCRCFLFWMKKPRIRIAQEINLKNEIHIQNECLHVSALSSPNIEQSIRNYCSKITENTKTNCWLEKQLSLSSRGNFDIFLNDWTKQSFIYSLLAKFISIMIAFQHISHSNCKTKRISEEDWKREKAKKHMEIKNNKTFHCEWMTVFILFLLSVFITFVFF